MDEVSSAQSAGDGVEQSPIGDSGREYRICTRCIMDTSAANISFGDDGVCNYCGIFDRRNETEKFRSDQGKTMLRLMAEKIKETGSGREYDCVVGVSGGVDSTMVAYTAKRLGLRALAVHFDNGWNSELAVNNISCTLRALDMELLTCVVDWEEFRDLQLAFLRASVPDAEVPTDHAIGALLFNTAAERGIRYILGGGNVQTEAYVPEDWGRDARDLKHLRAIHRRFGTEPLKTLPQLSLPAGAWDVLVRKIRVVNPLNYIDYSKDEAKRTITEELGWRDYGGKHHESIYTRFFQSFILPTKFGYDKRRAHLSNLVCAGEISRSEALDDIRQDVYSPRALAEERAFVVKKLGISDAEFETIMRAPPRLHSDYPGHHRLFSTTGGAIRQFKKIAMRV